MLVNNKVTWGVLMVFLGGWDTAVTAHLVNDGSYGWAIVGTLMAMAFLWTGYSDINDGVTEELNIQDFANKVDSK